MHRSFFSHFFETECGVRSNEVPEGLTLKMQHVNSQIHPSKICELRYFLQKDGWWATIICLFFHFEQAGFSEEFLAFNIKNFSIARQSNPAALALDAG